MDILTPFLPRINFVTPVEKSTLFVAGVSDNKTTRIRLKKNETTLNLGSKIFAPMHCDAMME